MDLVVGRVVRAHGVSGELVVEVRTDDPDSRFAAGSTLRGKPVSGGSAGEYTVESVRERGGRLLVRLAGVAARDAADAMRGVVFMIDSGDLPPIDDPDEFYDHQLEGLHVRTADGRGLGTVAEVLHTAAGELLAVRRDDGTGEGLEKRVTAIETRFPLVENVIEIDPPDGLLEIN